MLNPSMLSSPLWATKSLSVSSLSTVSHNQTFRTESDIPDLPEIFLQISDPANPEQYRVISGLCILVRSPAFHPCVSSCSCVSHVAGISGLWKQWNVMTCYTLYSVNCRLIDRFSMMSWFCRQMEKGIWPGFTFFAISNASQCSGGDLDGDDYTVIWAPVRPVWCLG